MEPIKKREAFNNNLQNLLDVIDPNDLHDSGERPRTVEGVGTLSNGIPVIVRVEVTPLSEVNWYKRTDNGDK